MKKECKDMHEAFWEAICVEHSIKHYRLRKNKMQEEKSPQTTEVHIVEPILEILKTVVEEQNQDTNDFPTNSDEKVQALKEEYADFEELNVVNQEPDHLVDFLICSIPKEPITASKEQDIISKVEKEEQIIAVPYID